MNVRSNFYDRYIPSRSGSDAAHNYSIITTTQESSDESSEANRKPYSRLLRTELGFQMQSLALPADSMTEDPSSANRFASSSSSSRPVPIYSSQPRQRNLLRFMSPPPVTDVMESTLSLSPMSKSGQDFISTQSRVSRVKKSVFLLIRSSSYFFSFFLRSISGGRFLLGLMWFSKRLES